MWTTPSGVSMPSSDTYMQKIRKSPERFRVLESIPLHTKDIPIVFCEPQEQDTVVVTIDFETTGLGPEDAIIEIGMARCRYSETGKLASVDETLCMLRDPGRSIPPHITKMTHITDEMVRGKKIDVEQVREMLRDDPLVVAHNAGFDRPLLERIIDDNSRWACSMKGIPWKSIGHDSPALGLILEREGWFFDAHSALRDSLAVAWLLHVVPGSLHRLRDPSVKVMAIGAPYRVKERLRQRGYWWNGRDRLWEILVAENEVEAELEGLEGLYEGGKQAHYRKINPRTQFR